MGIAPYQYVLQQRVERAKELLRKHKEMAIADVALQCGFANQTHFYKHFRKLTGMTPKSYRNQYGKSTTRNKKMLRQEITIENPSSLPLTKEIVEALGLNVGAKVSLEIVGQTLIIRSVEETQRAEQFAHTFQFVLKRRLPAYNQLAEGPQD